MKASNLFIRFSSYLQLYSFSLTSVSHTDTGKHVLAVEDYGSPGATCLITKLELELASNCFAGLEIGFFHEILFLLLFTTFRLCSRQSTHTTPRCLSKANKRRAPWMYGRRVCNNVQLTIIRVSMGSLLVVVAFLELVCTVFHWRTY